MNTQEEEEYTARAIRSLFATPPACGGSQVPFYPPAPFSCSRRGPGLRAVSARKHAEGCCRGWGGGPVLCSLMAWVRTPALPLVSKTLVTRFTAVCLSFSNCTWGSPSVTVRTGGSDKPPLSAWPGTDGAFWKTPALSQAPLPEDLLQVWLPPREWVATWTGDHPGLSFAGFSSVVFF